MEFFDPTHFHRFAHYLHTHPVLGALMVFGIAFVESLALIGGLFPGSVTMTAVGALIGAGVLSVFNLLWAALGAFLGDFLSYGIGAYYKERLKNIWPFKNHPKWLKAGRDFFTEHGGKSVLIGRFFGPVRSVVPLVAGFMRVSCLRFVIFAMVAAVLWAVLYIFPGIVVGALSLELPPATAVKFILIVLSIVAFGWVVVVLVHLFLKKLILYCDYAIDKLWHLLKRYRTTAWFTKLLCAEDLPRFNPHRYLSLFLFSCLCFFAFYYLLHGVIGHNYLTVLNKPLFVLLRSLRTQIGDNIWLLFTLLGDKHTLLLAAVLIQAVLFWKQCYRLALYWVILLCLSVGLGYLCKHIWYFPRPGGLLVPNLTSSFPSGHVLLSTAFFSFWTMTLIPKHIPFKQNGTNDCTVSHAKTTLLPESLYKTHDSAPFSYKHFWFLPCFLIVATALSRLFLGAHWLTDVLAGLFLGLGCATLVYTSYARKIVLVDKATWQSSGFLHCLKICRSVYCQKTLRFWVILCFMLAWVIYGTFAFREQQRDYTLYWPEVTLDNQSWWAKPYVEEPLFILSRTGHPAAVLNVQWHAALQTIEQVLATQGWKNQATHLDWKASFHRLSHAANPHGFPIWPSLYQNRKPVLIMTKSEPNHPYPLYFLLWKSSVTLSDSKNPLWIGSVRSFIPKSHKHRKIHASEQNRALYTRAMHVLVSDISRSPCKMHIKKWHISSRRQSPLMAHLHWNGGLVFVQGAGLCR